MKVALCFSGLPRMIEQTYHYWKHGILDKYNPDIFIHSWKTDEYFPTSLIQSLYHPSILKIDSPIEFDTSIYTDRIWPHRTTPNGVLSQWYSVKESINLKHMHEVATKTEYDIVVRARFDWYLKSIDFQMNKFINVADTPGLARQKFHYNGRECIGISDQFAYGSNEIMHAYSTLFDSIAYLYSIKKVDFCSELLLKAHLVECNIEINKHYLDNGITRITGVVP